jgi:hypothetical protein
VDAILKLDVQPIVATTTVAVASGLVVVLFAFVAGLPDLAAWPYLVASAVIHIGYYLTLAYETGYFDRTDVMRLGLGMLAATIMVIILVLPYWALLDSLAAP